MFLAAWRFAASKVDELYPCSSFIMLLINAVFVDAKGGDDMSVGLSLRLGRFCYNVQPILTTQTRARTHTWTHTDTERERERESRIQEDKLRQE